MKLAILLIVPLLLVAGCTGGGKDRVRTPSPATGSATTDPAPSAAATIEPAATALTFRGEINGIQLGVPDGPLPQCGQTMIDPDWEAATAGTPFDLNVPRWPERVSVFGLPQLGRCEDDGRVMWVIARLEVAGGPGVNGGLGVVQVSRWEAVRWAQQEFPADKVTSGTIAGRPAVFADVGRSGIAAVIVVDDETGGSTTVMSSNVGLEYLKTIAEALYP
jgi:hypothetical protein